MIWDVGTRKLKIRNALFCAAAIGTENRTPDRTGLVSLPLVLSFSRSGSTIWLNRTEPKPN